MQAQVIRRRHDEYAFYGFPVVRTEVLEVSGKQMGSPGTYCGKEYRKVFVGEPGAYELHRGDSLIWRHVGDQLYFLQELIETRASKGLQVPAGFFGGVG